MYSIKGGNKAFFCKMMGGGFLSKMTLVWGKGRKESRLAAKGGFWLGEFFLFGTPKKKVFFPPKKNQPPPPQTPEGGGVEKKPLQGLRGKVSLPKGKGGESSMGGVKRTGERTNQ